MGHFCVQVFEGKMHSQRVALKYIEGASFPDDSPYAGEVAILKDLRHPHIIQFLGAFRLVMSNSPDLHTYETIYNVLIFIHFIWVPLIT
jgi:hypothetical protein